MKATAPTQTSRIARCAIPACILLCAAALVLPVVATGSGTPGLPGPRSETSLVFTAATARLVGSTALVPVKCLGPESEQCTGSVTLRANGHKHKSPFALLGGTSQSLAVPVGSSSKLANRRAVAVARTLQPAGRYARSSSVLRLR
jgi:hypothetical protein